MFCAVHLSRSHTLWFWRVPCFSHIILTSYLPFPVADSRLMSPQNSPRQSSMVSNELAPHRKYRLSFPPAFLFFTPTVEYTFVRHFMIIPLLSKNQASPFNDKLEIDLILLLETLHILGPGFYNGHFWRLLLQPFLRADVNFQSMCLPDWYGCRPQAGGFGEDFSRRNGILLSVDDPLPSSRFLLEASRISSGSLDICRKPGWRIVPKIRFLCR